MTNQDEVFFQKLLSIYKVESRERVQEISNALIALEKASNIAEQKNILSLIFREIHSLKSASRSVNLMQVENVFKCIEEVYSVLNKNNIIPTTELLDIFHKINNATENLITLVGDPQQSLEALNNIEHLFKKLKENHHIHFNFEFKPLEEPVPVILKQSIKEEDTVRISSEKVNKLLVNAEEMLTTRLCLTQIINDLNHFKNEINANSKYWGKFRKEVYSTKKNNKTLPKNELINWHENNLKETELKLEDISSKLEHELHHFDLCINLLLDDTKKLLLWPFSTILHALPRMVRDFSHNLGKEIQLTIDGAEVEIDKRILEAMRDVILHLVRNAVDHGIETPDFRSAINKLSAGKLTISVKQISGNEILINLTDDGAGIDIDSVKQSAIKKGIIDDAYAARMTDEQALNLIYYSEVSTSKILTDLSGRGLGMAIIKDKIDKMGGEIAISSKKNVGTTFTIKLPLTLATFKGLLIEVSNQQFLLPIASIERILRIAPEMIKTVENTETIYYEGKTLSLVWLGAILGINSNNAIKIKNEYLPVVIISWNDKKVAFVVDNVLSEQEILVKNFTKPIIKLNNISAAAIASNGKPLPILNCLDLLHNANQATQIYHIPKEEQINTKVLLVEDSFTTRTLLKNILELAGYAVFTATNGLEAWNMLRTNDYSIIISDVEMPKMDGFELTKKIRSDKKLTDVPVILITSLESESDKEQGIEVGANAYLLKSTFDGVRLIEIMKRLQV